MQIDVDTLLPLLIFIATAAAVTLVALWFMNEISAAAAEVRQRESASGDTSLAELYINLSPNSFFQIRVGAGALMFMLGVSLSGMLAGLPLGVVGFFIPALILGRLRRKRVAAIELQLVDGLELLGNSLKSGLTLPQAAELLIKEFPPPISQEFKLVLAESRLGVDFVDALANMADRLDSTIVGILATGVSITKRCGGDLTVIFQNIANTIREQATIEGKLSAVTAQARFQGLVLSIMPFALLIVLWFIDRQHVETLFHYTIGIGAMCLVVLMVFLAQVWIRRLMAIDV